jgi:hypothetical protein
MHLYLFWLDTLVQNTWGKDVCGVAARPLTAFFFLFFFVQFFLLYAIITGVLMFYALH